MLTSPTPAFGTGDLVEVDAASVRAVARVRESSVAGRLHVALEMGEYLPWVDADVQIRHFGNDVSRSCTARILHAGASTALLQIIASVEELPPSDVRGPFDTLPLLEE
ncbi:MAG: hypothetical protein JWP87_34 [Labilithrix sp.]|nr:hypothetical protein [Labilithrix sp.]